MELALARRRLDDLHAAQRRQVLALTLRAVRVANVVRVVLVELIRRELLAE